MPWFRDPDRSFDGAPYNMNDRVRLRALIADVFAPGNCFAAAALQLRWQHVDHEAIRWEIYHGRLLDVKQTREIRRFESWGLYQEVNGLLAAEPTLSIKLDETEPVLHVVRGLLSYVWEGHDIGGNVMESRETTRWVRELVGSVRLTEFSAWSEVADELICLLWQAVVGTSRLPLTSLETPLPAFALGHLAYVFRTNNGADQTMPTWESLLEFGFHPRTSICEQVKLLEILLRAVKSAEIPVLARRFVQSFEKIGGKALAPLAMLRRMFNDVSLSPYTHFVDNSLDFVQTLVDQGHIGRDEQIDFLVYLLHWQCKHLTAYDLFTFHHRGANYPDALLLDAVLGRCIRLIDHAPEMWEGPGAASRRRRMMLCQACLLRHVYQDHPVPDLPTSPGENQRVLPPLFQRVPEEQILNPLRRQRKLYDSRPLRALLTPAARRIIQNGLQDMSEAGGGRELGLAVFIDRPFGDGKHPLEPDQTPLLAHEAFSPSLAQRRWSELIKLAQELSLSVRSSTGDRLRNMPAGVPVALAAEQGRPVPSLADARRVAEDFRVLRTLPRGLASLLDLLREREPGICAQLGFLTEGGVLIKTGPGVVSAYDKHARLRLDLEINGRHGFTRRAGMEFPRRLSVLSVSAAR